MARSFPAPDRVVLLLSVVPYLLEHGDTPITELAERFAVPARLMRELVRFLGTAGVPGETRTYQHEDLFDIDWTALEDEDVVRLTRVVAVDDAPRFSPSERAALIAGVHALVPVLPDDQRPHAESALRKLGGGVPAPEISVAPEAADARLALLTAAINGGRRVSFAYRDIHGAPSTRRVDPLRVVQSAAGWYLRAYCLDRGAERTFIVDGMRDLHETGEAVAHAADPRRTAGGGAQDASAASGGVPGPQTTSQSVVARLRVREAALGHLAGFALRLSGDAGDGWVSAEVDLVHPGTAFRLVQAAPGDVVVEAPDSARLAVAEWVDRALEGYRS